MIIHLATLLLTEKIGHEAMNKSIVATGNQKKSYTAPQLLLFGGIAAMTASGSGGKGENTMGDMVMGKFP